MPCCVVRFRRGVGKLILATPLGDQLVSCGRVGNGLTATKIRALDQLFAPPGTRTPAANIELLSRLTRAKTHWLKPVLVVEVYHRGSGNDGKLRHASLKALRPDSDAEGIGVSAYK